MLLFRMLPLLCLSISLPSPLLLMCTSYFRWPSPTSTSCTVTFLPLSALPGCYSNIPGATVFISIFNNELKDTIRQSFQSHVAHNAQGQDSGSCQIGWWLAQTGVCGGMRHMHLVCTQSTHLPFGKGRADKIFPKQGKKKSSDILLSSEDKDNATAVQFKSLWEPENMSNDLRRQHIPFLSLLYSVSG